MEIREYVADDVHAVLALVDRAWAAVFLEVNAALGPELGRLRTVTTGACTTA